MTRAASVAGMRHSVQVGEVISRRKSRETGTTVVVERTGPGSWVEQEPGWMTICEDHSTCVLHYTRAKAMDFAAQPSDWCEPCRDGRSGQDREGGVGG